jgi:amino acid adenylation domain-containing protein
VNVSEFVDYLFRAGIQLRSDGSQLYCSAASGTVPENLQVEIRSRKSEIVAFLSGSGRSIHSVLPDITSSVQTRVLPASFAQERLWFLEQLEPNTAYNIPSGFRIQGPLQPDALRKSFREIVRRHTILRTCFPAINGKPTQQITPASNWDMESIDLRGLRAANRETEAKRQFSLEERHVFDLASGPLFRAKLLQLAEEEFALLLTSHHIVFDQWSWGLLFRELSLLYDSFRLGTTSGLAELPIQYSDFVLWQREFLTSEYLEPQINYWKSQLGGTLPKLELTTDFHRPSTPHFEGAEQPVMISAAVTRALRQLGQKERTTLFMTLLAAFNVLLYRYSGQNDILVGTAVANRPRPEMDPLIGLFLNTLVLRSDLSGTPTFREFLRRVRETALCAYANQDLPFERLVEILEPERDLERPPLFQVMFLQNSSESELSLSNATVTRLYTDTFTAKFDLTLSLIDGPEGIRGRLEYSVDLFRASTIKRMVEHFQNLVNSIAADPDQPVHDLALLSDVEFKTLVADWNSIEPLVEVKTCVHECFEIQVRKTPDSVAVTTDNLQLTYRELNSRANKLANYLRQSGIGPDACIGIYLDRSADLPVAILAVLKAGGAYIPLDPAYPTARTESILINSGVHIVLTRQELVGQLPNPLQNFVCLDSFWTDNPTLDGDDLFSVVTPQNLANVIYTSGSTGEPKGVVVTHEGIVGLFNWANRIYTANELQGVLASTSICFDLSVFELLYPLTRGGAVVLADDILQLPSLAESQRITLLNTVPSAMEEVLRLKAVPTSVSTINLAGEPLRIDLVTRLYRQSNISALYNLYGPTESTVYSTFALITAGESQEPSIGRPLGGTQVYLLDRQENLSPIGVNAEIHLAGTGIARGYFNKPALTAGSFRPNPFGDPASSRLYKTGDIGHYTLGGNIMLRGRDDFQLKLRGYRIEPKEIEFCILAHEEVREAVVVSLRDETLGDRLVAYVAGIPEASIPGLRSSLSERLPKYMIPSAFVAVDVLPRKPNGKLDRQALPDPRAYLRDSSNEYVEPCTETQQILLEIWTEALGIEKIGIHSNFFDLGGHSLLATLVIVRISERFAAEIPLRVLFESPTIAELADAIDNLRWLSGASTPDMINATEGHEVGEI